jgi:ectoine hydroxylase-related dioxygenase (phytanoyl-CoA dioxygenase family)
VKSYWPRAGRVVLFDGRIPHVARSVETDKFRVSLVFKGTTDGMKKEEPKKDTSKDPFKGTDIEGKD